MSEFQTIEQALPESLQRSLARFKCRWRWVEGLTVLGLLALIPLISLGVLSVSDRLWDTPDWLRFVLVIPVPLAMLICCVPWLLRWGVRRPRARQIAAFMGHLDARVGDRLLGAVELAEGSREESDASPALRAAAIQQVAGELESVRVEERLDTRWLSALGRALLLVLVATLGYTFWMPDAARNSWRRWTRPHQPIERFTFVRFADFPSRLVVPHGEGFLFGGDVTHVRGDRVGEVTARLNGPEQMRTEFSRPRLVVEVEGLTSPRRIDLASGDARTRVEIDPLLRPELQRLRAEVRWPEYLGGEVEERVLLRQRLEVPEGSMVTLLGEVSRELEALLLDGEEAGRVEAEVFSLPEVNVDQNRSLALAWRDVEGLLSSRETQVEMIAREDNPPLVALASPAPAMAVLADEFVEVTVSARDDYGLTKVWADFRITAGPDQGENRWVELGIAGTSGSEELRFSPERYGFEPGQTVELKAKALDAYPGRDPSESSTLRLLVVSLEDHAQMVQAQMERLQAALDEVIRDEAMALEANRADLDRTDEDLADASIGDALQERSLEEQLRSEALQDVIRGLESLIAEAAKNELIGDQEIGEWAEVSESLRQLAQPAMQAAAQSMQQASASEEQRRDQLEQAIAQQEEALEAMRQGEENLDESIEQSISRSFVNRFRELARTQGELRREMEALLPELIGLPVDDIPEELLERLSDAVAGQDVVHRQTRYVYDDLEGFYRRSQREELREVTREMQAEEFRQRLPALTQLLRENALGRGEREALLWRDLFAKWAEMLSDDDDSGAGGGDGDGGEDEGESLETMIALLRAREAQERLREHTRTLDETYAENPRFDRDAVGLSDRQFNRAREVQLLENQVRREETKMLVSIATGEMMNAGVRLRQYETGQDTIAIQTEVIELLAQALEQSMSGQEGGGEDQQNSAALMQAIMEMMAGGMEGRDPPAPGGEGGEGSVGAGDPGRHGVEGAGSAGTTRDGGGQAGSVDPSLWPSRYRDMMDSYHRAMEAER